VRLCISDISTIDESVFYDACKTELELSSVGDPPPASPASPKILTKHDPDYAQLRPFLGWLSADRIKKTFDHTTQYARLPAGTLPKKAFKSPNLALNVYRRQEDVACDNCIL
jgi:hypothetical protein